MERGGKDTKFLFNCTREARGVYHFCALIGFDRKGKGFTRVPCIQKHVEKKTRRPINGFSPRACRRRSSGRERRRRTVATGGKKGGKVNCLSGAFEGDGKSRARRQGKKKKKSAIRDTPAAHYKGVAPTSGQKGKEGKGEPVALRTTF